jgi:uncharacterized membrane protein
MNDREIRSKSVEISVMMCAHVTSALIVYGGLQSVNEIAPFALVNDIEKYICTGEVPEPIIVKKL